MSFALVGGAAGYYLGGTAGAALLGAGIGAAAGGALASRGGGSAPQLDPQQIGYDSLATQLQLAPDVLAANQKYGPQYVDLQLQQLNRSLFGARATLNPQTAQAFLDANPALAAEITGQPGWAQDGRSPAQWLVDHVSQTEAAAGGGRFTDLVNGFLDQQQTGGLLDFYGRAQQPLSDLSASANTAQRSADIADVMALGPQAREAYLAANPELAATMQGLDQRIAAARDVTPTTLSNTYAAPGAPSATYAADPGTLSAIYANAPADFTARTAGPTSLTPTLLADAAGYKNKSAIQQSLEEQALAELGLNGALSPEDLRAAQQTARGAAQARGIYDSNAALSAEVLNTAAMKRQRQNEARTFASGVDAAGQSALNAGRSFATAVEGNETNRNIFNAGAENSVASQIYGTRANVNLANAAAANNAASTTYNARNNVNLFNAGAANSLASQIYGQQSQNAQFGAQMDAARQLNQVQLDRSAQNDQFAREFQLANMYQGQATDPFAMVLGRSAVPGQVGGAVGQSGAIANAGPQLFDPFNSNITSIYAGNAANQTAANVAAGNNRSAVQGSILGALGTLGGAYLMSGCWVARAAFGAANARWLASRRWMHRKAPRELWELYLARGPILARKVLSEAHRAALRSIFRRLVSGDAGAIAELTAELNAC